MISAILLAVAGLSVSAPAQHAGFAPDTVRAMKGHHAIPDTAKAKHAAASAVCHPDPMKGRACRHHHAKLEEKADTRENFAAAEVATEAHHAN